jgi:elongation factor P
MVLISTRTILHTASGIKQHSEFDWLVVLVLLRLSGRDGRIRMVRVSELERGSVVGISNTPHVVEELQVQTPSARGGASLYKIRFRNLANKQKLDKTFKGDDTLEDLDVDRREVQFLYRDQDSFTFMDLSDYNQFTLFPDDIGDQAVYLAEDMEGIRVLIVDEKVVAIELPPVVELEITECDPSIRGASATARTKPATLSTGLVVQVPEYISNGEVIRIDTRTGKFLSRA